jgi:hypothetical protein
MNNFASRLMNLRHETNASGKINYLRDAVTKRHGRRQQPISLNTNNPDQFHFEVLAMSRHHQMLDFASDKETGQQQPQPQPTDTVSVPLDAA